MKQSTYDETIQALCKLYEKFCELNDYEPCSADDLVYEDIESDHKKKLTRFIGLWDWMEAIAREQKSICDSDKYIESEAFQSAIEEIDAKANSLMGETLPDNFDEACGKAAPWDVYKYYLTLIIGETEKLFAPNK